MQYCHAVIGCEAWNGEKLFTKVTFFFMVIAVFIVFDYRAMRGRLLATNYSPRPQKMTKISFAGDDRRRIRLFFLFFVTASLGAR